MVDSISRLHFFTQISHICKIKLSLNVKYTEFEYHIPFFNTYYTQATLSGILFLTASIIYDLFTSSH